MRRLSILLLLLFLVSCSRISGVEVIKEGHIKKDQVQVYTIEKEQIPRDYAYVQDDNVILKDDDGSIVRRLFFQERVFVYRKRSGQVLIMDQYGNSGWVGQEHLSKQFVSDIAIPLEGVEYGIYSVKDKPFKDYLKVKGAYISPYGEDFALRVVERIKDGPINTLVLDYHDDEGYVLFESKIAEKLAPGSSNPIYGDGEAFIRHLKDEGFHLIARIVAFKDPIYAAQNTDRAIRHSDGSLLIADGQYWNSPYDREVWDYLLALSNEALELGFDEIQFDYVRFPDSFEDDMLAHNEYNEGRAEAIQKFLMFIKGNINNKDAIISADVFGWAAIELADVTIGQQWEALSNIVDVISPMFYPALYGRGVFDFDSPVSHPYEVLKISIKNALERNSNIKTAALIRPWIQGWDYSLDDINLQIKALEEAGIEEFIIWDPDGNYPIEGLRQ